MSKKKRFRFQVTLELEELSSVPLVSGILFTKIRLLEGGTFTDFSPREEVVEHRVRWRAKYMFVCKMVASTNTGILEPCICRISVRKEMKGGKSFQKLGFADINLAEFAGAGFTSRNFLLEGYDSKRRQDNSMLKIHIDMTLLSGDPLFKVPSGAQRALSGGQAEEECLPAENKGGSEDSSGGDSEVSGSSGFGSLPRKPGQPGPMPSKAPGGSEIDVGKEEHAASHSRQASCASAQSKMSGYSTSHSHTAGTHSRQSSCGEADQIHKRTPSSGSGLSEQSKGTSSLTRPPKKLEATSSIEQRVDSTRVDADELIDELIKNTDFAVDDSTEGAGLQLYIGKDGATVLGSQRSHSSDALFGGKR